MDSLPSLTRLGRSIPQSLHPADYRCSILGRLSRFRTNSRAGQRFWKALIFCYAVPKTLEIKWRNNEMPWRAGLAPRISQNGHRRAADQSQGGACAETNSCNPAGGLPCDEHGILGAEPLHRPVHVRLLAKQKAPDTWIVERKKAGRLMLRATWKLSADGNTLTDYYREFETDGSTLSLDYVYQRTGGGSGFAADWQSIKETRNTPLSMEVKAYEGDGLSFLTPAQHRPENVKFDGKDYPEDGSNAGQGL